MENQDILKELKKINDNLIFTQKILIFTLLRNKTGWGDSLETFTKKIKELKLPL